MTRLRKKGFFYIFLFISMGFFFLKHKNILVNLNDQKFDDMLDEPFDMFHKPLPNHIQ